MAVSSSKSANRFATDKECFDEVLFHLRQQRHAYEGGWTEVEAPSRATAMQAFSAFHRPVNGMTACPDIYTEEAFRKTGMLDGGNFGAKTREKITITREFF